MINHEAKDPVYGNIFKFLVLLKPYRKNIIVFILTGLVLTLISSPYPWLTKIMIDNVMLRQDNSLLYVILGATFILTVFRSIFSSIRNYYISYIQHTMSYDIELKFFRHLQKLSFSFFDSREIAEVLSRFRDAVQSRRILIDILNRSVTNLLYLCIVPMIVFFINWQLALMAGIILPWLIFLLLNQQFFPVCLFLGLFWVDFMIKLKIYDCQYSYMEFKIPSFPAVLLSFDIFLID